MKSSIEWVKALIKIREGETALCPDCKKGIILWEYHEFQEKDGMVVLSCSSCKRWIHFSHQVKIELGKKGDRI